MNEEAKKPNSYSSEFKESAVKLAIDSDQPIAQTAVDLGINENTLHTWINKYSNPTVSSNRSEIFHSCISLGLINIINY